VTDPSSVAATRTGSPCSACGGALDTTGRCAQCGRVFGEAYRCPHCHTVCDVEPHPELLFRCQVCGAPRIPVTDGAQRSGREVGALALARKEQLRMGALRAAAIFLLAAGALCTTVVALILAFVTAGLFVKGVALLAAAVPFVIGALALRNAARHRDELTRALDRAWLSVLAEDNQRAQGSLDAATIARRFGVTEARAELWLAELSVQELMGEVAPSVAGRLRVPDPASADASDAPDAETLAKSSAKSES
jgi:hypothetical protein